MAGSVYDEEYMIEDFIACMQANLNAEITLVNTDKGAVAGDSRYLDQIPNDSYIFAALDETTINYKGFFILYDLMDTPINKVQNSNALENVQLSFEVCTFDELNDNRNETLFKLLRYRRAVKNVVMKNPEIFRGYAKALMTSLKPNALPYSEKATILKAGIEVTASVTTY